MVRKVAGHALTKPPLCSRPPLTTGVEMVRKVAGHALTKPTREILFTVVSRQVRHPSVQHCIAVSR